VTCSFAQYLTIRVPCLVKGKKCPFFPRLIHRLKLKKQRAQPSLERTANILLSLLNEILPTVYVT
jgi:hypothetical protein